MEFNKNLLNVGFLGADRSRDIRSVIIAIKSILYKCGILVPSTLENEQTIYYVTLENGKYYFRNRPLDIGVMPIVSPSAYATTLLSLQQEFKSDWYKDLAIGSVVEMGWASTNSTDYNFGFSPSLVLGNQKLKFTISDIRTDYILGKSHLYDNGDYNIYHIKELMHWVPSAVLFPIYTNPKPIKHLNIASLDLGLDIKEFPF